MNVLLLSSSEGIAIQVANLLDLRGHRAHVFSIWHSGQESRLSRRCASYVRHVVEDLGAVPRERLLTAVTTHCVRHRIDAIIPVGLWGTFVVSALQGFLPVATYPTSGPDQIYNLHNKWHFYARLRALGVPTPSTTFVAPGAPLPQRDVRFPLVVKPVTGGGATGVTVCRTAADLAALAAPTSRPRLVQDFVAGVDGVFGAFAVDGQVQCWTLHTKSERELQFFPEHRIEAAVRAVVRDARFTGACNFDFRYEPESGRFAVIECNPRLWASVGVSAWYGVDVVEAGLRHALEHALPPAAQCDVARTRTLPNPDLRSFVKGVLRGSHPLRTHPSDLPWRMLTDPLPMLSSRLRSRASHALADDTDRLERVLEADGGWPTVQGGRTHVVLATP